jgi:predicted CopG family antitoxin
MSNKENEMTPKKVNVSINPETMAQLTEMKAKISQEIGFTPSYSEVIQYLIKQHYGQTDILS